MANVNIKFNGKEFLLSCDDAQEEHLEEFSIHLNEKFTKLKNDLGIIGENKLLLITSIKVMDEYFETKKKVDEKKRELKELSDELLGILEGAPVYPKLVGLESDLDEARPELAVAIDREKAALYDLNTSRVGNAIRGAINGTEAAKYLSLIHI